MPRIGLKVLPFPDRLDDRSMLSNLRTAWENFKTIDRFTTVSVTAAGTTVLTAISQSVFANAAAGNVALTVPSASGNTGIILRIFKTDSTTNTVTINGNVLGGNAGQSRLTLESDGTNWRLSGLYEEGTYTATLTGCTTSPTATVSYIKVGKVVTLKIPNLFATSNTTACTITGMPSHLWPATTSTPIVENVRDNSLIYVGVITISTAGVWTLFFFNTISTQTGTFTNVGTKGIGALDFSFTLQ